MVPLALSGEDHRCRAPRLGHPAHRRIALRRHTRGRQPTTAWQLALDHEHRALLGAVVEHFLGDDPRREVAERRRYHPLTGLLAPGDHAVAGHEVGACLDRRIGRRGRRSALDHPQARRGAPRARGPACGRRPASAGRWSADSPAGHPSGPRRARAARRVRTGRSGRLQPDRPDRSEQLRRSSLVALPASVSRLALVGCWRLEPLSGGDPGPHRLGAARSAARRASRRPRPAGRAERCGSRGAHGARGRRRGLPARRP